MNDANRMHIAKVEFEEARELADYASIFQDLAFVLDVLDRLHGLLGEKEPDAVVVQAYWTAALVGYVRCFSTGRRVGLSESIFEGIQGAEQSAVEVHRHFKAMRDKNIAHSVNPFEQVEVGVVLTPPDAPVRKIDGVATLAMRHISSTPEGVESLQELARIARRKTGQECQRLQQASLEVAGTLDLDELYETVTIRTTAPAPEEVSQPRT